MDVRTEGDTVRPGQAGGNCRLLLPLLFNPRPLPLPLPLHPLLYFLVSIIIIVHSSILPLRIHFILLFLVFIKIIYSSVFPFHTIHYFLVFIKILYSSIFPFHIHPLFLFLVSLRIYKHRLLSLFYVPFSDPPNFLMEKIKSLVTLCYIHHLYSHVKI